VRTCGIVEKNEQVKSRIDHTLLGFTVWILCFFITKKEKKKNSTTNDKNIMCLE
jgi:hypothetical protein